VTFGIICKKKIIMLVLIYVKVTRISHAVKQFYFYVRGIYK